MLIHLFSILQAVAQATQPAPLAAPLDLPLIVGHRGASGYRPEHTLESYQLAIDQGADFIEPDLVATKDKILVARHENEISETTDVAKKFPARKTTKIIDGESKVGWFTEDFTLAELKTLRANERLPFRNRDSDGKFEVPTFSEVISLVRKSKRAVGICPEIKHPSYFKSIGIDTTSLVIKAISEAKLNNKKVIVQSFEVTPLKELRKALPKVDLVFLFGGPTERPPDSKPNEKTYAEWLQPSALKEIKSFATILGPAKAYLLDEAGAPTRFVKAAHQAGLKVIPYTFRNESQFVQKPLKDANEEYRAYFALGIDGLFTDFPDSAVKARSEFFAKIQEPAKEKTK